MLHYIKHSLTLGAVKMDKQDQLKHDQLMVFWNENQENINAAYAELKAVCLAAHVTIQSAFEILKNAFEIMTPDIINFLDDLAATLASIKKLQNQIENDLSLIVISGEIEESEKARKFSKVLIGQEKITLKIRGLRLSILGPRQSHILEPRAPPRN